MHAKGSGIGTGHKVPAMKQAQPSSNVTLDFGEKYIPDEAERLKYLLERYLPLLVRDVTAENRKSHASISKLLGQETAHTDLLEGIAPIFATADAKPRPLILSDEVERSLGPNRSAEYLGFHADISYLVVRHLSKDA